MIAAAWLIAPSSASAQSNSPLYWDTTTIGTWSTAGNWWTTPTGTISSSAAGSTNDAVFDGSGVNGVTTVQLSAAASAMGLYFNNTGTTRIDDSSTSGYALSIGTDGITIATTAGAVTLGDPTNLMPISITGSQSWTNNSTTNALTVISAISDSASSTLTIAGAGSTAVSGIISDGSGPLSLTKLGAGTLTLTAADTYSGATTINQGSLAFNFSATGAPTTNIINNTADNSALVMGGGTLLLTGAGSATNSQQFPSLTLNPGASTITLTQNGAASLTASLGTITHTTGGTLNFSVAPGAGPTGVIATASNSNDGSSGGGILGTWATTGSGTSLSYATVSGGNIVPYTGGTAAATGANLTDTTGLVNYNLAASGTAASTFSGNTTQSTGGTVTVTTGANSFTVNGIQNAGTGTLTIQTNPVTIGANEELVITGNTQATTISSVIKNNSGGPSSLTYSGAGMLTLSGNNSYTGGTTVNGGTLSLNAGGGGVIGTVNGALTINSGATVISNSVWGLGFTGATYVNTITINGGTLNFSNGTGGTSANSITMTGGSIVGSNGTSFNYYGPDMTANVDFPVISTNASSTVATISDTVDLRLTTSGNLTLNVAQGTAPGGIDLLISGVVVDTSGTSDGGGIVKNGSGTVAFTAANTYTAGTTINAGTLQLGNGGTTGTLSTSSAISLGGGNLTFDRSNAVTQGTDFSSAAITGTGSLTQAGSGTLTLSASNTFSGTTNVNSGLLKLTGSLTNSAVSIAGGTLTGSGNGTSTDVIGGGITLTSGAIDFTKNGQTAPTTMAAVSLALNGGSLSFNLGGNGTDEINLTGALTGGSSLAGNGGAGTITVNINGLSGASTDGTYNLAAFTSESGLTVGGNLTLGTTPGAANTTYALNLTGSGGAGDLQLVVTGPPVFAIGYWTGNQGGSYNWGDTNGTNTNWSTSQSGSPDALQLPTGVTDVVFASQTATGASLTTNLEKAYTINSLTVLGTGSTSASTTTPVVIGGSGSLTINAAASHTGGEGYSAGTGIVIQSGAAGLTINTSGGVIVPASQSWTNNSTSTFQVSSNVNGSTASSTPVTLTLTNTSTGGTTVSGTIANGTGTSSPLSLVVNGSGGPAILTGTNTYAGSTTINAGSTLQIGNGGTGSLSTGSTITDNGSLIFNVGGASTQGTNFSSSPIGGTGSLTLNAGTLTLATSGNGTELNTYTGGTIVNGGNLILPGNGSNIGDIRGTLTINSSGIVNASSGFALGYASSTVAVTSIVINGGTLNFTGTADYGGGIAAPNITMTGGTISASAAAVAFDWYYSISSNPTITTDASSTVATLSSGINLRLNDNNSNYLTLNVAQGSVDSSGGPDLLVSGAIVPGNLSDHGGSITKIGAGTVEFTGANTWGSAGSGTAVTLIDAGTVLIGVSNVGTTSGALGPSTIVTDLGNTSGSAPASLLTYGPDTFTNPITVVAGSSGTLSIGGGLSSTSVFSTGAITLDNNLTVVQAASGALTVSNNITSGVSGTQTLTFNNVGSVTQSTGVIGGGTGTIALVQSGTGTTTLSGTNTYTGGTTINAGILRVGAIADTGTSNIGTSGTLTLGGGTLQYTGAGSSTTARTVSLTASSNIVVSGGSSANLILNGAISGSGFGLTLASGTNGKLTLGGTSTYSGPTNVNAGILNVTGSMGATVVSVASGGTLTGSGNGSSTGVIGGGVTIGSGGAFNFAADGLTSTTTLAAASLAVNGGSLTFNLGGSGTDEINLGSGALSGSGGTVNINGLLGAATSGTYNLVAFTSESGLTVGAGGDLTLGTTPGGFGTSYAVNLTGSGGAGDLQLVISGVPTPNIAYWTGNQGGSFNWGDHTGTSTNWSTSQTGSPDASQLPGAASDVVFAAQTATGASLTTNLEKAYAINSITVLGTGSTSATTTSVVTIGGSGSLTIEAANNASGENYAAGTGIVIQSGSAGLTINTTGGVIVPVNQSWTNNSGNPFLVSGNVNGSAASSTPATLTLSNTGAGGTTLSGIVADGTGTSSPLSLIVNSSGAGAATLSNANSYSGGTTLTAGTLRIGANSTTTGSGATLAITGSPTGTGLLAVNGGSLDLSTFNLAVNGLSGSGGTIASSSTGTAGSLTIVTGGTTRTYSGTIADRTGSGNQTVSVNVAGTGTQVLAGANTYSGPTNISAGNLQVDGSIANSSVAINGTGAVFSGAGTTGPATLTTGAISPGNNGAIGTLTTGALSLAAGTSLDYTLTSAGVGSLISAGALTLPTSGSPININITNTNGVVPLTDGTYPLINYTSLSGGNATFNSTFTTSFPTAARQSYSFVNTGSSTGAVDLVVAQSTSSPLIYQDTFNRNGSLNGSEPTFQNGTSNVWSAETNPNWTTSTSTGGLPIAGVGGCPLLPFVPASGNVYTLSISTVMTSGDSQGWVALGFGNSGLVSGNYFGTADNLAWMLFRPAASYGAPQYFYGGNNAKGGNVTGPESTAAVSGTLAMVLDTTGGLANTTIYWLINGVQAEVVTGFDASTFASVAISNSSCVGVIQNFSLGAGSTWVGPAGATGSAASWTNNTTTDAATAANTSGWSAGAVPSSAGSLATFGPSIGSTDQTITLDSSPTVGELVFTNSAYNSGGSPGSQGNYTIAQGSGGTLTFDNLGGGAVVYNYYGANTISAPVSLNDNLQLLLNTGTSFTISGPISDTGSHALTLNPGGAGAGTTGMLTLSGANTYAGGTTVVAGTLRVANGSNGSATGTGPVLIQSGATLAVTAAGGSATIVPTGANTVTIAGGATLAIDNGQTLTLGNGLVLQSGSVTNFNLTTPSSNPIVNITGGSLSASGAQVYILGSPTNVGTYDLYAVASGTFSAAGFVLETTAPSPQTSPPTLYLLETQPYNGSGTQLDLVVTSNLTWTDNSGSHNWDTSTTNNWAAGNTNATYADSTKVVFNDSNATLGSPPSGTVVVQAGGVFPLSVTFMNTSVSYVLSNSGGDLNGISGAATVSITNGGTVTFNSPNTYTGATTITSGTLILGNSNAVQNSVVTVGAANGLQFAAGLGTANLAGLTGSGNIVLQDNAMTPAPVTLSVGSGGGSTAYSGSLGGSGSLRVVGGTLTLSSANSYSGGTTIQNGTLRAGITNALPTSGTVTFGGSGSNAGTLDLNGYNLSVGGLAVAAGSSSHAAYQIITNSNTSNAGATATLNYSGGTSSFTGTLKDGTNGSLALTVSSGALTLNGFNNYSGATTVNGGTLRVGSTGSLVGGSAVTVNPGGTLGGSGAINGLVTVENGGVLASSGVVEGATEMDLAGGLFLSSASARFGGPVLNLNLGFPGSPGSGDYLNVTGDLTLGAYGVLNINPYPGPAVELTPGDYPLIYYTGTLTGGINTSTWAVDNAGGDTGHNYSFAIVTGSQDSFDLVVGNSGGSATWSSNGNTDWGTASNWAPAVGSNPVYPNGPGQIATFGTGLAATIQLSTGYTVGGLVFNNNPSTAYTLSGGGLMLNNNGSGPNITVTAGSVYPVISTPLILADGNGSTTTFNVAGDSYIDVSGAISETASSGQKILLNGGGTLQLDGVNSYTGGTTVASGTLIVGSMGTGTLGTGPLAINGSTSAVNADASLAVGSLSGTGGGQLNVGGSTTLTVNQSTSSTFIGTLTLNGGLVLANASGNTLTISGAPTLGSSSSITVNSGTLALTNNTAGSANVSGPTYPTVSVAPGATLQLAGSQNVLSSAVNITTHGGGLTGDGALTVVGASTQTVGVVSGDTVTTSPVTTYAGNTTVGDGTNAANLTATQILQNTLTINAGSTVTIAPSGSGIPADEIAATAAVATSDSAGTTATSDGDSTSDPFTAIEAAIAAGSISSVKGEQLENRIAAIQRLAATDPGLDVSLLEDRVLAALPPSSVWSSTGATSSSLAESGSGLLAVDSGAFVGSSSTFDGATDSFAPSVGFSGSPAAVPEPSTLLLAALGFVGLVLASRRRTLCRSQLGG